MLFSKAEFYPEGKQFHSNPGLIIVAFYTYQNYLCVVLTTEAV